MPYAKIKHDLMLYKQHEAATTAAATGTEGSDLTRRLSESAG